MNRRGGLVIAAAVIGVGAAGAVHAQTAAGGLSPQEVEQMRQELQALRAEEAARQARIDALARQLARATGEPVIETLPPPTAEAAARPAAAREGGPKFEVYGFAQVDYIQDFNRVNPAWEDTLRPSKIPTLTGAFGSNDQASTSVKQSRFGAQASTELMGLPFYAKFEFDLFGVGADEGKTTFRLRHAYGSWGPLLAGQTNTVFMDGDIFPNVIDYWGPTGMVFIRNAQIRYTYKTGRNELAVAIEKPNSDIDPGNIRLIDPEIASAIQNDETLPDLTAHWRYDGDWGHVQLAGVVRRVGFDSAGTPNNEPKGHKTGWGVNLTSNIKTFGKDVFHGGVVYGEGIASYMNDGGTDLGPKGNVVLPVTLPLPPGQSLSPDVLPLLGLSFYYDHYWTDKLSTSLGWSSTTVDNTSFQASDAFHEGQYASVNLIWQPDKALMMGAEYLWGQREDNNGAKGIDNRLQFSVKYSFSSNDFWR
jgi:hypothetical protein